MVSHLSKALHILKKILNSKCYSPAPPKHFGLADTLFDSAHWAGVLA